MFVKQFLFISVKSAVICDNFRENQRENDRSET